MQPNFKRIIIGVSALAVAAGGLIVSNNPAQALPLGTAPNGSVTIPATQLLTTTLAMAPNPAPALCSGNGVAGYRWHAFISNTANDPATLTYTASGATAVGGIGFTSSLLNTVGNFVQAINPSSTGQITPIPGFDLAGLGAALVPGTYNIGFACSLATQTTNYWSTPITVTATSYSVGVVPAAPVLTTTSVTATSATVNFTHAASTPATTGYTATVTPTAPAGAALAPISVPAGATSFAVPGLTTGTTYSVSLTATNTTGASPASNTLSFTPSAAAQPAIVPTLSPGVGQVTVNIPAVTIGGARTALPTSYTLAVSPAPGAPGLASYTIPSAAGPLTQVVPGITAGAPYTFTLTVSYTSPDSGPGGIVAGTSNSAQIIQQRITVTRPLGQLILTQRCGVNGGIPNFTGTAAVPGFPTDLPAIVASPNQIGTTPDITPAAPGLPANTVDPDSEFGVYPFPLTPIYPTECGISLGTSTIVTSGAGAGLYFQADGRINEVTVSDTRDTNRGWTLNGRMNDFIGLNTPTNTFDGDWMGWVPQLQNSTANQIITTGGTVLPGTGVAVGSAGPGLGSGRLLGSAAVGAGLGVTQFDARLLLLIPTNTPTDDYVGLLDFTVA